MDYFWDDANSHSQTRLLIRAIPIRPDVLKIYGKPLSNCLSHTPLYTRAYTQRESQ